MLSICGICNRLVLFKNTTVLLWTETENIKCERRRKGSKTDEECQLTDGFRGTRDGFPKALSCVSAHFPFHICVSCFFIAFLSSCALRFMLLWNPLTDVILCVVLDNSPVCRRPVLETSVTLIPRSSHYTYGGNNSWSNVQYCGRILERDSYFNFQSTLGFQQ
jgi:hypothetical protein